MIDQDTPAEAGAEGQAPQGAPQQGADQQKGNPVEVVMAVQKALAGMAQAFQDAPVPPEGKKHLENAMNEYNAFVSITGKALGVQMPDAGQKSIGMQSAQAGGNPNAQPADMPTRKGAQPMMG